LLAHSFGGSIALSFSSRWPDRIDRLVLIASAPELHLPALVRLALKLPLPWPMLDHIRPAFFPRLHAPLPLIRRILLESTAAWRGWQVLPTIQRPVLILGGQHDRIVPARLLRQMCATMPHASCMIVPGAHHLLQLEQPDLVNTLIERFLEPAAPT